MTVALNVVFQLVDRELLLDNCVPDEIADRYHADQQAAVNHRKMTYPVFGHDCHAFVRRLIETNVSDGFRHDIAHGRLF